VNGWGKKEAKRKTVKKKRKGANRSTVVREVAEEEVPQRREGLPLERREKGDWLGKQ